MQNHTIHNSCQDKHTIGGRRSPFILLPGIIIIGLIALFFTYYPVYIPSNTPPIIDCTFNSSAPIIMNPISRGYIWNDKFGFDQTGGIRLPSHEGKTTKYARSITNLPQNSYIRVSAMLKSENISAGDKKWQGGRFDLYFLDQNGKIRWDIKREVVKLLNNHDWQRYEAVFHVPEGGYATRLVISNSGKNGTLLADNISIVQVNKNPNLPAWRTVAATVLALTLFGYLFILSRNHITSVMFFMLVVPILLGVTLPNHYFTDTINTITAAVVNTTTSEYSAQTLPSPPQPTGNTHWRQATTYIPFIKRMGHTGLFFLLSIFVTWRTKPSPPQITVSNKAFVFLALLLFAASTEVLQNFSPSRTPRLSDLGLDTIGIIGGIIIGTWLHKRSAYLDTENRP